MARFHAPYLHATFLIVLGWLNPASQANEDTQDLDEKSLLQIALSTNKLEARQQPSPYHQTLSNFDDLQYTGRVTLGNQPLNAVLDTGSFEILAFSRQCMTCGQAGVQGYDSRLSSTFVAGQLAQTHVYGSGSAMSYDGVDTFAVGPYHVQTQDFWEALQASMPVLSTASFQAIVGLGPPGEPQRQANQMITRARGVLNANPPVASFQRSQAQQDLHIAELILAKNDSLLMNLNVRYLSSCLEWATGAPGHIIWHDVAPSLQPVPFAMIPVVDDLHWAVQLTTPRFEGPEGSITLGCTNSCQAILDTGTSLIAVPTLIYNKALARLSSLRADCSNMQDMPNLVFTLGGHDFSLPPQSYVGIVQGGPPPDPQGYFRKNERTHLCQILLLDAGATSQWIIGMPFFRYYYTTFDLGPDPMHQSGRKIWAAPADQNCAPATPESHNFKLEHARQSPLWIVNSSKIRVPRMSKTSWQQSTLEAEAAQGKVTMRKDTNS